MLTAFSETFFASESWFRLWLDAFGGEQSGWWPVESQGQGAIQIPYVIEIRRIGPFHLRVAAAAANSHTPRFDGCGTNWTTAPDLRRMMRSLSVAALVFPFVSSTSRLASVIERDRNALSWHRDSCESSPYVDCNGDWEQYLTSRGKTRRDSWLYYERRALKAGCTFHTLANWEEISGVFEAILDVEASGWKGEAGTAIAQDMAVRDFYTKLCEDLARHGRLRVFLLRRQQQIVAFQICSLYEGTLSCLKIGYLESYSKESPGQVLQLQIVRYAFAQSAIRIFDMLGPASETKLKWATGVEQLFTYYIFRAGLGGAIAKFRWQTGPKLKDRLLGLRAKTITTSNHPTSTPNDVNG